MRVLVVEDEPRLAEGLRAGLTADGFAVDVALTGTDGLWLAREVPFDAIVLDVMLPGLTGDRICRLLRDGGVWTPILMLTALDDDAAQVHGLDVGADDYLTKPFSHEILVARLRALLRRGSPARPAVLAAGDLRLDPASRRVWRGQVELELTAREVSVLKCLLRFQGEVLGKREILAHVWDYGFEGDPNIVEVYVRRLRDKVDRPFGRHVDRDAAGQWLPAGTRWRLIGPAHGASGADATWPPGRGASRPLAGSVRARITAAVVVVVAAALLVGATALVAGFRAALIREAQAVAEVRVAEVVRVIDAGGDPLASVAGDDDVLLQVRDGTGRVVEASPGGASAVELGDVRPAEWRTVYPPFDDDPFTVTAATAGNGRTVVLGRSLGVAVESTRTLIALLALGLPLLLILVGATAWRAIGRALLPVETIRVEVEGISASDTQRRVPQPAATDEIGRLAATMNQMLDRLELRAAP